MKNKKIILMFLLSCVLLTGCIGNPYKAGIKSLEEGEYSNAAAEFQEAIEKEKNLADSYRGLGVALWEQKEYEQAYDAFKLALSEGTKESSTIYSLMGNCSMKTEEYETAIECFEMALSMKDISEELKKETEYNLIAAYEYTGNVETAREKAAQYLEEYPDDEQMQREMDFLETR